jgi:hypothetical protein
MPLDKLIVTQLVKKLAPFIDSEGHLLCSQEPPLVPVSSQLSSLHLRARRAVLTRARFVVRSAYILLRAGTSAGLLRTEPRDFSP